MATFLRTPPELTAIAGYAPFTDPGLDAGTATLDGANWRQMRIAHLHACPVELQVGVYACSPTGAGFSCRVTQLQIELVDRDTP